MDLLFQALDAETACLSIATMALDLTDDELLRRFWTRRMGVARQNAAALNRAISGLGVRDAEFSSGRELVAGLQRALVDSLSSLGLAASVAESKTTALECALIMERKANFSWMILAASAQVLQGERGRILRSACDKHDQAGLAASTEDLARMTWLKEIGIAHATPAVPIVERRDGRSASGGRLDG